MVYVREEVSTNFATKSEAEAFEVNQTQYPTQEERLITDNQEDVPYGIRD